MLNTKVAAESVKLKDEYCALTWFQTQQFRKYYFTVYIAHYSIHYTLQYTLFTTVYITHYSI